MALFENEKLTKINERITELNEKREKLQGEIDEILEAVSQSVEAYAMGEVDEETVEKAKAALDEKTKEVEQIDEMLERVKGVRKSVAMESVPFVKEARLKKVEKLQKEYDKKVIEVREARNAFIRKMAELGAIDSKVGDANHEYNSIMRDMDAKTDDYGKSIHKAPVVSGGYTVEAECIGVSEATQNEAAAGIVPHYAKK